MGLDGRQSCYFESYSYAFEVHTAKEEMRCAEIVDRKQHVDDLIGDLFDFGRWSQIVG